MSPPVRWIWDDCLRVGRSCECWEIAWVQLLYYEYVLCTSSSLSASLYFKRLSPSHTPHTMRARRRGRSDTTPRDTPRTTRAPAARDQISRALLLGTPWSGRAERITLCSARRLKSRRAR